MRAIDTIYARGHPNILATHKSTLEITKENYLTKRGDCVIGISANKSVADLNPVVKEIIKTPRSKITLILESEGIRDEVHGSGDPRLILSNPISMVVRKSSYISDRTLIIYSDKAAIDIRRDLINVLRDIRSLLKVTIIAEV